MIHRHAIRVLMMKFLSTTMNIIRSIYAPKLIHQSIAESQKKSALFVIQSISLL